MQFLTLICIGGLLYKEKVGVGEKRMGSVYLKKKKILKIVIASVLNRRLYIVLGLIVFF